MTASSTLSLITNTFTSYGYYVLIIIGLFLGIALAYLVFKFGYNQLQNLVTDKSYKIGGYYIRNLPYKGYHRFRSEKWNMNNM